MKSNDQFLGDKEYNYAIRLANAASSPLYFTMYPIPVISVIDMMCVGSYDESPSQVEGYKNPSDWAHLLKACLLTLDHQLS